jgi:hypothetical protein
MLRPRQRRLRYATFSRAMSAFSCPSAMRRGSATQVEDQRSAAGVYLELADATPAEAAARRFSRSWWAAAAFAQPTFRVLCFDTQNQQKGELEKIGAWVKEYGKPVVAVLNVRNPLWRRPGSVPLGTGAQRRRLSRAVREHVTNIETELAALSIYGAPVAISAQRAMYARVAGEYRGPAEHGRGRLQGLARFPRLKPPNVRGGR